MRKIERQIPDWIWDPQDHWSRWKGYGRILILLGLMLFVVTGVATIDVDRLVAVFGDEVLVSTVPLIILLFGVTVYGVGLLGLRMEVERRRKQS